jgi:hypothetical protein
MYPIVTGNFADAFLAFDRFEGDLCLELSTVLFAFVAHVFTLTLGWAGRADFLV